MTILESLEIARNGCYLYAHTLEIESKKRVCKSRSKQDKIEMKECAKTYNEAADRIHPVISCWPEGWDDEGIVGIGTTS